MSRPHATARDRIRQAAPAALLALSLARSAAPAGAQDLGENAPPPADQGMMVNNGFTYNDSVFNQWVFGNNNSNTSARDRLDAMLKLRLADVERSCPLGEAQRRKLLLAGRGDVKRFDDRLAEARAVFDRLKTDQNRVQEILQQTQPLNQEFREGLFGEGSLFSKTLASTLDSDQSARYAEAIRERRRFQFKARVLSSLANVGQAASLSSDQTRRVAEVVMREAPLPLRFGDQYDNFVVLLSIARVPEGKIRPIFADDRAPDGGEARWRAFSAQLQQGRNMERFLETNGYVAKSMQARAVDAAHNLGRIFEEARPAPKPADPAAAPRPAAPADVPR